MLAVPVLTAGDLVLAQRGRAADCTIVVRAQATSCERYAADELRDFLKRQTGVELTIADDGWGRTVTMRGEGYSKIVIWTPGPFKAGENENLDPADMLRFVCVEPATLFRPDAYTLAPGAEHVLSVSIAVH